MEETKTAKLLEEKEKKLSSKNCVNHGAEEPLIVNKNDADDLYIINFISSHQEVFLEKGVLKVCSKFTGEHTCRSAISIKLLATLLKSYFGMTVLL